MTRLGGALLVAAALLGTARPAAAQTVDLLQHVALRARAAETVFGRSSEAHALPIDETLAIDVDELGLIEALAASRGAAPGESPLVPRTKALQDLVLAFLETQRLLLDAKAAALGVERALQAGAPQDATAARAARDAASDAFARQGLAAIDALEAYANRAALSGDLIDAERRAAFDAAANQAVLEDYGALAKVVQDELDRLGADLSARLAAGETFQFHVRAALHDDSGGRTDLHVDGYDTFAAGEPLPYKRFRFAVDGRTKAEMEAAGSLKEAVEAARDGTLQKELETAAAAVREELELLRTKLESEVLRARLDALAAKLRTAGAGAHGALLELVEQVRALVALLSEDLALPIASGDVGELAELAFALQTRVRDVFRIVDQAAAGLPALVASLQGELDALPDALRADAQAALEAVQASAAALASSEAVKPVLARLRQLEESFGLAFGRSSAIASKALEVGHVPRALAAGGSLDTSLDLQAAGGRHPGDLLIVTFALLGTPAGAGPDVAPATVAQARATFRLRLLGFYGVTRGALIFADPRSAGFAGQDFEPSVSISYLFHYGWEGSTFWNDVLNPGLGLSLSLLDFEDAHDLELGLSATLTVLDDLMWVGYGRDLQAEADFFYFGLNPLALGDLWRQGDSAPLGAE